MKLKKKLLILIAVLLVGGIVLSACSSSSPSLRGKVYYNNTDSMVYNAEVLLDGQVRDTTNYYGEFYISGLNEDSYTLRIRKKDAIQDYVVEEVFPSVNGDLGIIRVEPVADTTTINGRVNINNLTLYKDSEVSRSSTIKSASNFKQSKKKKYVQDEIIVKYNNSTITSASNSVKEVQGLNIAKQMNRGNGELVKFKIPAGKTVEEMIEYFSEQPGIEYAEPNYYVYAQAIPNDTYYEEGFDGGIGQWGSIAANLEAAWDEQKYSNSVTVAVLDSGIIPDHEDLEDNISGGANFVGEESNNDPSKYIGDDNFEDKTPYDDNNDGSHGTHVAGLIGAITNNGRGVSGVSWGVNIMPVKVLDKRGGELFDVLEGIYYSIDREVNIINLSLGIPADKISDDDISSFREAIEEAVSENIVVVAAAGNTSSMQYPALFSETIAVGSVDIDNQQASYSATGSRLDLVAPGGDTNSQILSTWGYYDSSNDEYITSYEYMSGTSMSAAYVSGAAALLLESGVRPRDLRSRLTSTAVDLGEAGKDEEYGYGLLDAYGALLNKRIAAPYVFAATESSGTIKIESNSTRMNSDGSYSLSDRINGDYKMVAWRDINNNFEIDGGDYFGITESDEYYQPDEIYDNQDINMYYVTESSSAASLSVEGIEKLRD